ncbi:MAG TPA: hypothetical protein VM223_04240 [Planctomycetota bacterium]|nr:hypothetical protein [Thermoguttaceae bacterium]HUW30798.1 hypothetical protein [Planctomycetota bacterium]
MPRDNAEAKKTMDKWQKSRAKEQRRAAAIESSRPRPTVQAGQAVEVAGNAKVQHVEGAEVIDTNHEGAVGLVESTYYSEEKQTNVAVVRCEDNQIRGIPEHKLRSMKNPAKQSVSKSSVSMSGTMSQDRWDSIFGKKAKE